MVKLSKKAVLTAIDSSLNPVDKIWTIDRPVLFTDPLAALSLRFAGKSWQDKITELRKTLASKKAIAFVVTSLDETAWLFNVRGTEVPYNPFFMSFAIVEVNRIRLYILDRIERLTEEPDDPDSEKTLAEHLETSDTGTCSQRSGMCVEVLDYDIPKVKDDIRVLSSTGKVWIPTSSSYSIYDAVEEKNRFVANSPVAAAKSVKNPVERVGMQNSSDRDSAVLISFLAFLEKQIAEGNQWSEMSAAIELDKRRGNATYSRGSSFEAISSFGPHAAMNHYEPTKKTNKVITDDGVYLLDSGGHYLDGSTDVTRSMHYGTPTNYVKECYTRVLASTINLATLHWPSGLYGRQVAIFARYQLWDVGLSYRHGTGHGVGAYLSIHEGPGFIGMTASQPDIDLPLAPYQFFSDEPGYYEANNFGFRLETMLMVAPFAPKYNKTFGEFLCFKPITLVPFETKMIDFTMLTKRQVEWLNDYNKRIRSTILPLLTDDPLAIDWVKVRTEPIGPDEASGQGVEAIRPSAIILIFFVSAMTLIVTAL